MIPLNEESLLGTTSKVQSLQKMAAFVIYVQNSPTPPP